MKTKTFPAIIQKLKISNGITRHEQTLENPLGQSGIHTIVSDIMDIVLGGEHEKDIYRSLIKYLTEGQVET